MFKKNLLIISALIATSTSIPVYAANWIQLGYSDNAVVSADEDSVLRDGKYLKAWVMYTLNKPQPLNKLSKVAYQSSRHLEYFDCASKTSGVKSEYLYSEKKGNGKIVASSNREVYAIKFIDSMPDSLGEQVLLAVCGTQK